ncbi:hypothetical protein D3C78_1380560 [compost metagenome]
MILQGPFGYSLMSLLCAAIIITLVCELYFRMHYRTEHLKQKHKAIQCGHELLFRNAVEYKMVAFDRHAYRTLKYLRLLSTYGLLVVMLLEIVLKHYGVKP